MSEKEWDGLTEDERSMAVGMYERAMKTIVKSSENMKEHIDMFREASKQWGNRSKEMDSSPDRHRVLAQIVLIRSAINLIEAEEAVKKLAEE